MRSTLALLPVLPGIHAWGQLGHATVAYIAQDLIAPETVTWAQKILGNSNSSYLGDIASWADDYRYTSAGHWSEPLHFIDAMDSPPSSCSVDYSRDCGKDGCIVSAMMNYTQRVKDTSLSSTDLMEALEFIVHFTGDATQPLHCENLDVGGNDIDVTFGGEQTNLHSIWDTAMLEKLRGSFSLDVASAWAQDLVQEIKTGNYSSQAAGWLADMNIADPQSSSMSWVTDSNTFDCSYVLKQPLSYFNSTDLSGAYYEGAVPVFTQQIAKGGYRLAAWLNLIATGSTQVGGGGSSPSGTASSAPASTGGSTPSSAAPGSASAPASSAPASAPASSAAASSGGYGSPSGSPSGYGSAPASGYASAPTGGYGSAPASGYASAPTGGYGGYSSAGGYGSASEGYSGGSYEPTGSYAGGSSPQETGSSGYSGEY